jgi:hypothetical protein
MSLPKGFMMYSFAKGVYNLHALVTDAVDGESDRDSWRRMRLYAHRAIPVSPLLTLRERQQRLSRGPRARSVG